MQPKQLLLLIAIFIFASTASAQEYNPFKEIGKKAKVLTLSKGKYDEFFDYQDIQRIGTVMFNIRTKKIVKLLNADSVFKKFSDNSSASRWYSPDPMADKFASYSPYNFVENNPINRIDPDGRESTSTHTDKNGKVIAVYNDGDNSVYKHDDLSQWNKSSKLSSSGKGVTNMGSTEYWDEFASHDATKNIVGDKNGNFAEKGAQIFFGSSIDNAMANMQSKVADKLNSFTWAPNAVDWLKNNSRSHQSLDIKTSLGAANGYLFQGKYTSGESLGNYFFGANLASIVNQSGITAMALQWKYGTVEYKGPVFTDAARAFGAYHNASNHVNNPAVAPYYGEIPYSGRNIAKGYYQYEGGSINPITNTYGNAAIYGNVLIK